MSSLENKDKLSQLPGFFKGVQYTNITSRLKVDAMNNFSVLSSKSLQHLPEQDHILNTTLMEQNHVSFQTPILIQITIAFYVIFSVVIALTNIITIFAILTRPELKNITNMFVLSLSSADLLLSPCLVLINFLSGTSEYLGPLGMRVVATVLLSIMYTSSGASLFSILAIAVDRYFAVIHPYNYKEIVTAKRATVVICFIWIYCILFNSSLIGYYVAHTPPQLVVQLSLLSVIVPIKVYLGAIISQITVSVAISVALYVRIFIAIKQRSQTSLVLRGRNPQTETVDSRRVTNTMALVLGALIVSWTPYTVLSVVVTQETIFHHNWLIYLSMGTILLLYSNSFMNPIIYAARCSAFRKAYWDMLCYACRQIMRQCGKEKTGTIGLSDSIRTSKESVTIENGHAQSSAV